MKLDEFQQPVEYNGSELTREEWEQHRQEAMLEHGSAAEYYQKMEMSSRYVNTHRDTTYTYEPMALHSHHFYEIISCRSTCGVEYLIGPYRYSVQKGDILLIRPGTSHCVILPEHLHIPYERDIIWINEDYLYRIIELMGYEGYQNDFSFLIRTAGTPWEHLCDMIHQGVREEELKQESWRLAVMGNTFQVLAYMRRAIQSQTAFPIRNEKTDLLDQIIGYIDSNFSQKITLEDLAKHFYVSDRTISSLFRQRLGMTFGQFLTQRRLIAAKTFIAEGLPMEEVAEKSGFSTYSTFYRAFRQEFGTSPRNFK